MHVVVSFQLTNIVVVLSELNNCKYTRIKCTSLLQKKFKISYGLVLLKGQQAQPKSRNTVEVLDLHIASSLYTNNT